MIQKITVNGKITQFIRFMDYFFDNCDLTKLPSEFQTLKQIQNFSFEPKIR